MNIEYFLGANSSRGFYSLYSEFCRGEGDYLHIIKGGPGTGKSSFMRRIGARAEKKGMDVEYVLCSGDPDSLDGVYIPALHRGWMDGTAPHTAEPRYFGFDSDYVNLGQFCHVPSPKDSIDYVNRLNQEYKACYREAYDFMRAESLLGKMERSIRLPEENEAALRAEIRYILAKKTAQRKPAIIRRRFLHGLCCKGELYLTESFLSLCKQYYVFPASSCVHAAMSVAAEEAAGYCSELIICPDPLEPEYYEAVLLPELSLGFIPEGCGVSGSRELFHLFPRAQRSPKLTNTERGIRDMALERLHRAKQLHDQLESLYCDAVDFTALEEFTEEYVKTAVG